MLKHQRTVVAGGKWNRVSGGLRRITATPRWFAVPLLLLLFADSARPQAMELVPTVKQPALSEDRPEGESDPRQLWLVVQTGPSRGITALDISPDGRFAVNAGDGTPRVWNLETGEVIRELPGHDLPTSKAVFSEDGNLILTRGYDSQARLWDWRSGRMVRSLGPHEAEVTRLELELPVWQPVALSADGSVVLSTDRTEPQSTSVLLWDAATGREIRRFGAALEISAAAMSSDAELVLFANPDGEIEIWNAERGEAIGKLRGHTSRINALALSRDGKSAVSGCDDRTARLWCLETRRELHLLAGHEERVADVALSADGTLAATCSPDSTARVWNAETGEPVKSFRVEGCKLEAVALTPDGSFLVTAGDDRQLHRFAVDESRPPQRLGGTTTEITTATFADDPPLLIATSPGAYRVWDVRVGRQIEHRVFQERQLVISPGGRRMVALGEDMHLFELPHRAHPRQLPNPHGGIASILFTGDDAQVVIANTNGVVTVRNCDTLEVVHQWRRELPFGRDTRFTLSPRGNWLVFHSPWSADVWDVAAGKRVAALASEEHPVKSVAFADDESLLVTSNDRQHVVREAGTFRELARIPSPAPISGPTVLASDQRRLAFPDGRLAHLIDLQTGRLLHTFSGHSEPIHSLAFTADGSRIVTAGTDQTCRIWDAETGGRIALLAGFQSGGWVVVDAEGRFDGSDGGEVEGLHWVVGEEAISLAQLKSRYYEPQLLAKALGFHDEPRREVAAFSLPGLFPRVEVEPPQPEAPRLNIHLENQGGGIGRVVVKINGKEVLADARAGRVDPEAAEAHLVVDLTEDPRIVPGEENLVEITAYNREGFLAARSRRMTFRAAGTREQAEPELWAVVAGVSDYRGEAIDLRYAAKDAEDFAVALRLGATRLFGAGKVRVTLLTTGQDRDAGQPTRANILAALEAAQAARPSDLFVLYLAGHGVNHGAPEGEFYYLTAEAADAELTDPEVRAATSISSEELTESIRRIPALKQVMILDTCASGRLVERLSENRGIPSSQIRALERVQGRTGMHVLAGCAADAVSYEASRYGQGLLTHSLLLGMRGGALREDEYVDVLGLFHFAADRVPELARDIGGIQRPTIASPRGGAGFDLGRMPVEDREKIPLQSPLPLILRANFQDEIEFADTLSLSKLLNDRMRSGSVRGGRLPAVFVDAVQLPGAYRLLGRYEIEGDEVTVRVHVFQDEARVGRYSVQGHRRDLESLAAEIVRQADRHLGRSE